MHAIGLKVIRVNDGEVRRNAERIANWIIEQAVEGDGDGMR
jgi:very-short-patch-repair endonuclease